MTELKALQSSADKNKEIYDIALNGVNSDLLESFESPHLQLLGEGIPKTCLDFNIKISSNEFTCLCPITGQPDFATIEIEYTPHKLCIESKSLKLYFLSYRNHKGFHEDCVIRIGRDLVKAIDPEHLTIKGLFTPRGGIPFHPTFYYNK